MLRDVVPNVAGHLLAASIMHDARGRSCWPRSWCRDRTCPVTAGHAATSTVEKTDANVVEAAASGASDGVQLALNVAAMLIAFIALVALLNA